LARRTGELQNLFADVAYEKDVFEFEYGTNMHLRHIPNLDAEDRGKKKCVYAVANYKDGGFSFVVLPIGEVNRIRDTYVKKDKFGKITGPWVTEYDEMAKKTAVKRLMKLVPLSVELLRKFAQDETVKTEILPNMEDALDDMYPTNEDMGVHGSADGSADANGSANGSAGNVIEGVATRVEESEGDKAE